MKLASTRIVTSDVSKLAQFYEQITGIAPQGGADYVEFRTSGSILALCSQRVIRQYNADAADPQANRSAILEFQVEDVEAERSRLEATVVIWVQEPTDQPWGNRSMLFRDPDDNLINFFTPVPRRPG
jgi:catechol 2,3-dioxygenase-like lactoylglutathione lyase family enzyme